MTLSRRTFFTTGLALAATTSLASPALATTPLTKIQLICAHTHRQCAFVYSSRISRKDYMAFNSVTRDWRENTMVQMDQGLLTLLASINLTTKDDSPYTVLSGYRTLLTNSHLNGTAARSLHMSAKALDIRRKTTPLQTLHATAVNLKMGGVGYYPQRHNDFVHVDTGEVRTW